MAHIKKKDVTKTKNKLKIGLLAFVLLISFFSIGLSTVPTARASTYELVIENCDHGYVLLRYTTLEGITFTPNYAGTYNLEYNTEIQFTGIANETGYVFDHFTYTSSVYGSGEIYSNPVYSHLLSSFSIGAVFVSNATTQQVNTDGTTGTSNGWSIDGSSWNYLPGVVDENTNVTVRSLIGTSGYVFSNWTIYENGAEVGTSTDNPLVWNVTNIASTLFYARWDYETGGDVPINFVIQGGAVAGGLSWSLIDTPFQTYPSGSYSVPDGSEIHMTVYTKNGYTFQEIRVVNGTFQGTSYFTPEATFTVNGPTNVLIFIDTPDFTDYGPDDINYDLYSLIYMIVGIFLTFGGMAVFIKAPEAWFIGLIFSVLGFVLIITGQTNLMGLVAWGLTACMSLIFMFTSGSRVRSK